VTLPLSRNTNYTPGSPVKSSDLNDMQDAFIGRKFPPTWSWRSPLGRAASEINVAWDFGGFVKATSGGAAIALIPVAPNVGDRITVIGARILGTGAGLPVVVRLVRHNGDGGRAVVATLVVPTPLPIWAPYTATLPEPEIVADQNGYTFEADIPTADQAIQLVGFASDRL